MKFCGHCGAPIAYDDPIRPACHAALQVQKRLAEYKEKIAGLYGVSFQMRMGIHSGRVVVGTIGDDLRLDYTAVGDTTNVAARLQALAGPEEILVSDRVLRGAESQFRFRDAGIKEIKGRTAPEACFRIGWISFYMHQPALQPNGRAKEGP